MIAHQLTAVWKKPPAWLVVLWLLAFVLGVTGWPTYRQVLGTNGKDITQPFPCMHSHCGCKSAAQCWKSCCCKTMSQKLAWAKDHGVQPPTFVVTAAAEETRTAVVTASSCCEKKSCCATKQKTCCTPPLAVVKKSCCQTERIAQKSPPPAAKKTSNSTEACCSQQAANTPPAFTWVLAIEAQKCQGLPQIWLQSGMMLALDLRPLVVEQFFVEQLAPRNDSPPSHFFEPETPPPRALHQA